MNMFNVTIVFRLSRDEFGDSIAGVGFSFRDVVISFGLFSRLPHCSSLHTGAAVMWRNAVSPNTLLAYSWLLGLLIASTSRTALPALGVTHILLTRVVGVILESSCSSVSLVIHMDEWCPWVRCVRFSCVVNCVFWKLLAFPWCYPRQVKVNMIIGCKCNCMYMYDPYFILV